MSTFNPVLCNSATYRIIGEPSHPSVYFSTETHVFGYGDSECIKKIGSSKFQFPPTLQFLHFSLFSKIFLAKYVEKYGKDMLPIHLNEHYNFRYHLFHIRFCVHGASGSFSYKSFIGTFAKQSNMSADLLWMIVRNNNSFLVKRNGLWLSKEPNNLKGRHCFRYSGLVHKKTIGVEPCKDGKGVVYVTRRSRKRNRPSKAYTRIELKKDPRRTLTSIRKMVKKNRYRVDLKMAAMRKASALIRSQRPVVKKAGRKKKE